MDYVTKFCFLSNHRSDVPMRVCGQILIQNICKLNTWNVEEASFLLAKVLGLKKYYKIKQVKSSVILKFLNLVF